MQLATAAQMKEIDRIAIEERKIPIHDFDGAGSKGGSGGNMALPYPRKNKGVGFIGHI